MSVKKDSIREKSVQFFNKLGNPVSFDQDIWRAGKRPGKTEAGGLRRRDGLFQI